MTSATPVSSLRISWIFLPRDRVAVLLHVELGGRFDLPAGRGERARHRQDQADLDGLLRLRRRTQARRDDGCAAIPSNVLRTWVSSR